MKPHLSINKIVFTFLLIVSTNLRAEIIYSDRSTFEATLEDILIDDYSNPAYTSGDIFDSDYDIFTNTAMSAVFGETIYQSTGYPDWNIIASPSPGEFIYCAGCNGSFLLDFTDTSIGTPNGVYGVGLDIVESVNVYGITAFITFGDGSTANYALPDASPFWGITSELLISSIHFGLPDGGTLVDNGRMAIDNLTIGSVAHVPAPATTTLMLFAMGIILIRKR